MTILLFVFFESFFLGGVFFSRAGWENFSKFTDKYKKQYLEVFCQKIFLKIPQNSPKNIFAGVSILIKLQAGILKLSEAATGDVLSKIFLKISQISQENTCVGVFLKNIPVLKACNFIKKDFDQMLSC